ncbi:MAG: glycoside hydrolase family 9 protein [Lentisphaeria bacterium]|nr:glycoside hydrolase family 9 protein [Lentisphaeria bacterium]
MSRSLLSLAALSVGILHPKVAGQVQVTRIGPASADIIVEGTVEPGITGKPEVLHVGMAAPDAVALTIRAQSVEHGRQVPYEAQPGDEIVTWRQHRFVRRGDARIGALVGAAGKILCTADRLAGEPLDTRSADQPDSYRIVAERGGEGAVPVAVFRKSKPVDCTRGPAPETSAMEHTVTLRLGRPLEPGKGYAIHIRPGLLARDAVTFELDPARLRSEAVHVNQVGFRPDDPVKLAFVSFWAGTGGPLEYAAGTAFQLVDDKTGGVVFSGKATLAKRADEQGNKTRADIHELDFSAFRTPGTYRVSLDGVGCSFPFEIGPDVWKTAFVKSMRGLYCQRSGIALGPPHTPFVRPRGFHPDDGVTVYVSEPRSPGEQGIDRELNPGLRALVASYEATGRFQRWVQDLTNRVAPDAWGGYMDAGDWDRRPDHALMPLLLFDLAEMLPDSLEHWTFGTPDSADGVPDLINEALWEVDFLRRMQQADGSVYGAIESGEHPRRGEASWQESLPIFAYARTPGVAFSYAADAARAALWFQTHDGPDTARGYRESALRAFAWAESQLVGEGPDGAGRRPGRPGAAGPQDARCLAAAELYRLTGDGKWHEIFLTTTRFRDPSVPFLTSHLGHLTDPQGVAAWTYLRTEHPGIDRAMQGNIRTALLRDADRDLSFTASTDFHWSGGPGREIKWGALSKPESHNLVRAHFLTGDPKYLRGIVLSALTGAGANPVNMCYVTGVGSRWPQHPLHEDAYVTGQPLYEGVTVGGPIDPASRGKHPNAARFERMLYPPVQAWPATESYYDVFTYAPMNEFTVHQTMLPTSFAWGYLAGRK